MYLFVSLDVITWNSWLHPNSKTTIRLFATNTNIPFLGRGWWTLCCNMMLVVLLQGYCWKCNPWIIYFIKVLAFSCQIIGRTHATCKFLFDVQLAISLHILCTSYYLRNFIHMMFVMLIIMSCSRFSLPFVVEVFTGGEGRHANM